MNLPNGTILKNEYKIVRFIAAGGFGCTYEAIHLLLGKHVAIKEFFISDFCNRDAVTSHVSVGVTSKKTLVEKLKRKFIEEARALAQMSHPNIVNVSDVFEEKGTAYFVMDYIDGKSLAQIVFERGHLPEQEALRFIKVISLALKYVHSQKRLHLDIKPANIMVKRDGSIFLIDFGVSKQYDEIDGQNTSTLMGYSSGYAPVEQVGNRVKSFTPATDIYALGATFYTLLTGIMPPMDSTERAFDDTLKPLPETISVSTRKAIEKAMNVRKNERIQSIDEFLKFLELRTELSKGPNPEPITMVDLGLPSGTKWANMNIGAKRPEDFGIYYGWGELYPKSDYSDVQWNDGFATILKMMGVIDSNNILKPKHDVAHTKWGGSWRIPSFAEIKELIDNTTSLWTTRNGVHGRLFTSKLNGNSIFIPASGYYFRTKSSSQGKEGVYWTSTFNSNEHSGISFSFNASRAFDWHTYGGKYGYPIRPVSS